jgi:hypothetical protein
MPVPKRHEVCEKKKSNTPVSVCYVMVRDPFNREALSLTTGNESNALAPSVYTSHNPPDSPC